jgi:hypothetical protein
VHNGSLLVTGLRPVLTPWGAEPCPAVCAATRMATHSSTGTTQRNGGTGVVAGTPGIDHPAGTTALSVLPLGRDRASTSRVRRETAGHLVVAPPRDPTGALLRFVARDLLELSWQADDGLRSVMAEVVGLTDDAGWRLRITGPAQRVQRRDAVRAPIGLSVSVGWDGARLAGSTLDLSEGGLHCAFRPHPDLGLHVPFPKRSQPLLCRLDLRSDELVTETALVRRRSRPDSRHEWSLRFLALPEPAADLIRAHVFTALREARARGLTTLY